LIYGGLLGLGLTSFLLLYLGQYATAYWMIALSGFGKGLLYQYEHFKNGKHN